jgi:hypothetical protein
MRLKVWIWSVFSISIAGVLCLMMWKNISGIHHEMLQLSLEYGDITISETKLNPVPDEMEPLLKSILSLQLKIAGAISLITLCFCTGYFFLIINDKRFFRGIITRIDQIAGKIDGVSYDAAQTGGLLSSSVHQQSAAISQTVSAHAEIADQIRRNQVKADQINMLIQENTQQMTSADATLNQLVASMNNIGKAGKEIRKIVDVINSIASQTNLLSINAGVESARAGDVGAAFSVISDEMRHLALHSTASAQETASLVKETIERVQNGSKAVQHISEVFKNLMAHHEHLKKYMTEIAATAMAQAEKIRRLDSAVSELETLAVGYGENARKTDSISGALKKDAEALRLFISDVISHVLLHRKLSKDMLEEMFSYLNHISEGLQTNGADGETKHRAILSRWRQHHLDTVEAVYSCDTIGSFIFSEPPAAIDNARIRPWWQEAVSGCYYVSPIYISAINGQPCCTLSIPFYNNDQQIAGVLGVDLKV